MTNENLMLRQALWVFLRPLIQLITNLISPEVGEEWLAEFKRFLRKEPCWVMEKAVVVAKNLLSVVKSVTLAVTAEKRTADCFGNQERYYYRDPNLDILLPEIQGAQPEGKVIAHQLDKPAKFVEMVRDLLGTTETDIVTLSQLAIKAGQVFSLPQIEALIERQETGEDVGLRTDGWANFFLVLNKEGSVSVLYADRNDRQWFVYLRSLADGNLWSARDRFFSRN